MSLRLGLVTLVLTGGCRTLLDVDDPLLLPCFEGGLVTTKFCLTNEPPATRTLEGMLDTSLAANCTQVAGDNLCVITGETIVIAPTGAFSAFGNRPLVLVAIDKLTVDGTLSVSSHRTRSGAGAKDPCTVVSDLRDDGGGGGGAGGSFRGLGGFGGAGDGDKSTAADGDAAGGIPGTKLATPDTIRGGCRGGDGGRAGLDPGGNGGRGGGAVYAIALEAIVVNGTITANGEGAVGGNATGSSEGSGGGGGGSGGLIGFHAPSITFGPTSRLLAKGGGGGEGGGLGKGKDGEDPQVDATAAAGGLGTSIGGDGGLGGTSTDGGGGQPSSAGGGGGGGGAGHVYVKGVLMTSGTPLVLPAASVTP